MYVQQEISCKQWCILDYISYKLYVYASNMLHIQQKKKLEILKADILLFKRFYKSLHYI